MKHPVHFKVVTGHTRRGAGGTSASVFMVPAAGVTMAAPADGVEGETRGRRLRRGAFSMADKAHGAMGMWDAMEERSWWLPETRCRVQNRL